ncbi:glycosyltransferase [Candidatus Methanodesulfokora washburnensis]|nr:glycosyltransferase [Candidatus Methanodesulfokores washburnensis]
MRPELSLVIPAYNEEKRITTRIQNLIKYFDRALGEYELLVIADGCTDKTPDAVSEYTNNNPRVRLFVFPERLGKGGAIIEGFKLAKGDAIVIADADDSVPPEEILKLVREAEDQDVVIGSRYTRDSKLPMREPFLRYFLGRSFNALTKLMFWRLRGIADTQCGAKVVKRYVADKILGDLFITGFAIDVNLIYSAMRRGFKVKEVGITYTHIEHESKVSKALAKLVLGMFFSLIKLRLYYSRFRPVLDTKTMRKISSFLWNLTKA